MKNRRPTTKNRGLKNPYLGSGFDRWLRSELCDPEFRRLFEQERAALQMGDRLQQVAKTCGLSIRKLAKRMRTSPSQVQRLFSEDATKCSLETLIRFSVATGFPLDDLVHVAKAA